jgi:hypothetical protein
VSTSFNFPDNPTLNQIVALPDGGSAQWNGYAWVSVEDNVTYPLEIPKGGTGATNPDTALSNLGGGVPIGIPIFKSTTAAAARAILGLNGTIPWMLQDGTAAAPALAWASEPGLGWYRDTAGERRFASGGTLVEVLNTAVAATTGGLLLPRAAGSSSWALRNAPLGAANYNQTVLLQNADGSTTLQNTPVGTATDKNIYYGALGHIFSGAINAQSGIVTTGFQCANIELVEATYPFIDFRVSGAPDFSVRLNANSSWPSRLTLNSQTVNTMLLVEGSSGGVSFSNVDGATSGGNTIAFGWRSDAKLGLRVDGSQFGALWPIDIGGRSNTCGNAEAVNGISGWSYTNLGKNPAYIWATDGGANYQYLTTPAALSVGYATSAGNATQVAGGAPDYCSNWGFAGGDKAIPYMRRTGQDVTVLIWQTTNDSSVRAIRDSSDGGGRYLETSGSGGAFGVRYNVSDVRLKTDVAPARVDATAAMRKVSFIGYDIFGSHRPLGFNAQNLESIDPTMVFDVEQGEDSPHRSLGALKHLDPAAILAYVAKALVETINRVDRLEQA